MTAPVTHQRRIRGRSKWSRYAWALLRGEMAKARGYLDLGERQSARHRVLEARALCIKARTWDRGI